MYVYIDIKEQAFFVVAKTFAAYNKILNICVHTSVMLLNECGT